MPLADRSPRGLRLLGALIAFLLVVGGLYIAQRRMHDLVPLLVPIVRESRIDLLERLSTARQEAGYPPDTDWRGILIAKDDNRDEPDLPLLLPFEGALSFPEVPIHPHARFTAGIRPPRARAAEFAGLTVTFRVSVRADGREVDIAEATTSPAPGDSVATGDDRVALEGKVPAEFEGRFVDFVIRTRADRAPPSSLPPTAIPELSYPALLSPGVLSDGVTSRMESVRLESETLVADLLDRFDETVANDAELEHVVIPALPQLAFAIETHADGTTTLLPNQATGTTSAFEALNDAEHPRAARGGPRAAMFFGTDCTLARFPVDVPKDGATLAFAIGVDWRSFGIAPAGFTVEADGTEIFDETLDPGTRPEDQGWRECRVDLAEYAGRHVVLAFSGAPGVGPSRTIERVEQKPLGPGERYRLEVKAVRGAFAEPRVLRKTSVPARLAATDRPSVIVVNVEAFRADAPSFAGGPDGITPALDRLAAEGTRFADCITAAPWTAPSVASLFTGLYPQSHGVESYENITLAAWNRTLAEEASAAGVTTAAFVSNDLLSPRHGFDQGFSTFLLAPYANARQLEGAFADWLAGHADVQFLAYLHLFEPHDPANAPGDDLDRYVPAELKGKDAGAALGRITKAIHDGAPPGRDDPDVRLLHGRYLGEVRYFDRQLERLMALIERTKLAGRVVVVVTGDHGEEFLEHGLIGHGSHLNVESVHVPLVAWGPGIVPAANVVGATVEQPQLFATILGWLGVDFDRSRARPALGFDGRGTGAAYSVTAQGIRRIEGTDIVTRAFHALYTPKWTLIHSPAGAAPQDGAQCWLFDRGTDPAGLADRIGSPPPELTDLKRQLERVHAAACAGRKAQRKSVLDAAMNQSGYIGGPSADARGALDLEHGCGSK